MPRPFPTRRAVFRTSAMQQSGTLTRPTATGRVRYAATDDRSIPTSPTKAIRWYVGNPLRMP